MSCKYTIKGKKMRESYGICFCSELTILTWEREKFLLFFEFFFFIFNSFCSHFSCFVLREVFQD